MGKELPNNHHFESRPSIGGYGIYGEGDGGFEMKPATPEDEQRFHEALHGKDAENVVEDPGFVVIQATPEQEEIHKRVVAAHGEQIEGFDGLKGKSLFDLPKDKFGIEDEARIEKVIVDFRSEDYKKL